MTKRLLILSLIILPIMANAQLFRSSNYWRQFRHEVAFGIGGSNALTEVGGRDQIGSDFIYDLEMSQTKFSLSGNYRYFLKKNFAVRASFFYAQVSGSDALTNEEVRRNRNLNFKSPIAEISIAGEIHLTTEKAGSRYHLKGAKSKGSNFPVGIYTFLGVGAFYYNPKALDGTPLRKLGTEGQGLPGGPKAYKPIAIAFPMGIGFRYSINTQWRLGLEFGYRFTTTDYLDDVSGVYYDKADLIAGNGEQAAQYADPSLGKWDFSGGAVKNQRGDPSDKDGYGFAQINLIYKITKKKHYGRGTKIRSRKSMPSF